MTSNDCSAVKSAVVGFPLDVDPEVVVADVAEVPPVSFSELSLNELSLLFPLKLLWSLMDMDWTRSRDREWLSSFCLTMREAYPSDNFFMKFQASSRVILVQSVLLTDKISSPTFNFPLLSAAPPVKRIESKVIFSLCLILPIRITVFIRQKNPFCVAKKTKIHISNVKIVVVWFVQLNLHQTYINSTISTYFLLIAIQNIVFIPFIYLVESFLYKILK